jgi:hypothetical protein
MTCGNKQIRTVALKYFSQVVIRSEWFEFVTKIDERIFESIVDGSMRVN